MHSYLWDILQIIGNKFARRSFLLGPTFTHCLEDLTDDTLADEDVKSILDADDVVTLQCIALLVDVDEVVAASEVGDVEVDADQVW